MVGLFEAASEAGVGWVGAESMRPTIVHCTIVDADAEGVGSIVCRGQGCGRCSGMGAMITSSLGGEFAMMLFVSFGGVGLEGN